MKRKTFAIITVLLSIILAVAAVEFVLRFRAEGSWQAVWTTLRTGGQPYIDEQLQHRILPDPLLGYRLNPTRENINSLGMRNAEVSPAKPEGLERIIVIGDSVAWPSNGFVKRVGDRLAGRAEVINAAIPGYTTYQERMFFERDLLALDPDLLVVQYCLNDNHRFLHNFNAKSGMLFTEEARRVLLPEEGDPLSWLPRWSYLALRLRIVYLRWRTPVHDFPWEGQLDFAVAWQEQRWESFREHLRAMRDAMRERGGDITVVMFPYGPQFRPDLLERDRDYVLKPQRLMKQICEETEISWLDMYPVLTEHGGRTRLPDKIHLDETGHDIATGAIYEHLTRNGLVEPSADEDADSPSISGRGSKEENPGKKL